MKSHADLEARLDAVESRQQIEDLVYRYTEFVRDRNEKRCAELMIDDAIVELHHGDALTPGETTAHQRFCGKEEILGSFKAVAGLDVVVWPMIHNLRVEIDGDTAKSRCVMMSSLRPHGMQHVGEYSDTFKRCNGRWLFASRRFTGFGDLDGKSATESQEAFDKVKV